ncbi:inositol monophosphatase family protein [Chamaesiphon sp. VAR_48_metabat_135_sub]|uniref:inositol monophosphatase family protein n=1 Tax=Chamaesiphon sp. VAR_48_metabat_135_sub TaxID=2964699 RepID=UPI00286A060F|nr:inositol monophosphatase family protein [Chamaesiphon sp. VAR_48_metabat_135_sub]
MEFWTQVLDVASTNAQRVGAQLLLDFGHAQGLEKADGSLVTQSDEWADREIRSSIIKAFPDHAILSEEGNHEFTDAQWTWIIDPLDGTTNFTRGIPLWGVSIGLLYYGEPVFGYVYFPPVSQAFHGYWAGNTGLNLPTGAYLNGRPIHVSQDSPSSNHFFSLCARSLQIWQPGFPCKVRMLGVATYNFLAVAAGASLGGVEATPKIWDLAAVWAILHAAGGSWQSLRAEPTFPAVAGRNYGNYAMPSLIVNQSELADLVSPLMTSIRK